MATPTTTTLKQLVPLALLLAVVAAELAGQASAKKWDELIFYCDAGCRQGPCHSTASPSSGVSVASVVTDAFFNRIIDQPGSGSCLGKRFYSRSAFLAAANANPAFGTTGSQDDSKREIAAFFAHVYYEIGPFCDIDANGSKGNYCSPTTTQWPCNPSKSYHPRGPLQLTYNYNYGPAGKSIGFDGLNSPETVANDPVISFKASLWFWMTNVHSVLGQGFGATIGVMDGTCKGGSPSEDSSGRVTSYKQYCQQLGVSPGGNLTC